MNIIIASDHAGYDHKLNVKSLINSLGHNAVDLGVDKKERADYPDYAEIASKDVACGKADMAILICGTGIGMSIAANKVKGIRAAVGWNTETAVLAREHNDANVLCMGARFVSVEECIKITEAFIKAPKIKEERHLNRVKKIMLIEERNINCGKNKKKT